MGEEQSPVSASTSQRWSFVQIARDRGIARFTAHDMADDLSTQFDLTVVSACLSALRLHKEATCTSVAIITNRSVKELKNAEEIPPALSPKYHANAQAAVRNQNTRDNVRTDVISSRRNAGRPKAGIRNG